MTSKNWARFFVLFFLLAASLSGFAQTAPLSFASYAYGLEDPKATFAIGLFNPAGSGKTIAVPGRARVTRKRLWCDRLPCGHIVATLPDGTMLLCTRKRRHSHPCFNPVALAPPPQAQCQFWRAA